MLPSIRQCMLMKNLKNFWVQELIYTWMNNFNVHFEAPDYLLSYYYQCLYKYYYFITSTTINNNFMLWHFSVPSHHSDTPGLLYCSTRCWKKAFLPPTSLLEIHCLFSKSRSDFRQRKVTLARCSTSLTQLNMIGRLSYRIGHMSWDTFRSLARALLSLVFMGWNKMALERERKMFRENPDSISFSFPLPFFHWEKLIA